MLLANTGAMRFKKVDADKDCNWVKKYRIGINVRFYTGEMSKLE